MCNIRLIKKEGTSKIDDQISKFENIHINLIDMPAYIVQIFDDKTQKLEFFFSNDKEDKKEYTTNSIVLKYGINSGRIYLLETEKKEMVKKMEGVKLTFPPFEYCTDNAAMISVAAYFQELNG